MTQDADTRIAVHEAVCAERYKAIEHRLQRTEYLQYITIVAILLGPGVASDLVKKLAGL